MARHKYISVTFFQQLHRMPRMPRNSSEDFPIFFCTQQRRYVCNGSPGKWHISFKESKIQRFTDCCCRFAQKTAMSKHARKVNPYLWGFGEFFFQAFFLPSFPEILWQFLADDFSLMGIFLLHGLRCYSMSLFCVQFRQSSVEWKIEQKGKIFMACLAKINLLLIPF